MQSGVHYGDKSETLDEWLRPVSITGSYDCGLTFFEPMFSEKWLTGCNDAGVAPEHCNKNKAGSVAAGAEWPLFDSGVLEYNSDGKTNAGVTDKGSYHALPRKWTVRAVNPEVCKVITAEKE